LRGGHHESNVAQQPQVEKVREAGQLVGVGDVRRNSIGQRLIVHERSPMLLEVDQDVRVDGDDQRTVVAGWQQTRKDVMAEAQPAILGDFVEHPRRLRRCGKAM
jgi:hypothetical protein